jgi:acetamidase/formamidase
LDDGHALTGPVYVRGAEPGMTLAVRVDALRVGDWGVTLAGGWSCEWNALLGVTEQGIFHTWRFDEAREWATNSLGFRVRLRPFLGVMGMPLDLPGIQSTVPPRATGGNIDCKELVVGSTLYLPVAVPGGLFSTGDGHGAQGDGEVSVTAIEVPMTADLTFDLVENMPISAPIANTPAGWVTMGFDEDLDKATVLALNSMLELMGRQYGVARLDALALASVCVDMRITQMVNQVRGVHAVLPHGALTR